MKRFRAAVIGGSGYGGAEIIRRLLIHPQIDLVRVASIDHVGDKLGAVHLSLTGRSDLRFENLTPRDAAAGCDVVMMCLPHKVSALQVPQVLETGAKVIDMSGDFRLRDADAYARYYGAVHPRPDLLDHFVYGLPELNRDAIRAARAVAAPGCFATTIELALLPLALAGKLGVKVRVVGITGSSGSGVTPSLATHHPIRAVNLKTYRVLEHQHTPEITQTLAAAGAADVELSFVPVSAPLSRGILATCFVDVAEAETTEALAALYWAKYAAEPFVRFVSDRLPEVVAVAGSNFAEVGFTLGERESAGARAPTGRRTLVVVAATDNLIKGGAGQAIQSMNLMLGLPETLSLEDSGPWP
jgi:N-acetyl-gamma-glutamyl-phosphate/LysW-gamma-L-alpha-aminoadipyl-6-phosphate reductase